MYSLETVARIRVGREWEANPGSVGSHLLSLHLLAMSLEHLSNSSSSLSGLQRAFCACLLLMLLMLRTRIALNPLHAALKFKTVKYINKVQRTDGIS